MSTSLHQFKNALDKYLEAADMEPVIIEMSRGKKFVLISYDDYKRFVALEDAVWVKRAKAAEAEGYASPEEVKQLLGKAGLSLED